MSYEKSSTTRSRALLSYLRGDTALSVDTMITLTSISIFISLIMYIAISYLFIPSNVQVKGSVIVIPAVFHLISSIYIFRLKSEIIAKREAGISQRYVLMSLASIFIFSAVLFTLVFGFLMRDNAPNIPKTLYGITLGEKLDAKKLEVLSEKGMLWKASDITKEINTSERKVQLSHYQITDPMQPETDIYILLNDADEVIYIKSTIFNQRHKYLSDSEYIDSLNNTQLLKVGIERKINSLDTRDKFERIFTGLNYHKSRTITYYQERLRRLYLNELVENEEQYWVNDDRVLTIASNLRSNLDPFYDYRFDVVLQNYSAVNTYLESFDRKKKQEIDIAKDKAVHELDDKTARFFD
jgi:hypothetical protein